MIVGYILIGTFAGLLASAVALFLGASFWLALGLYSLVGSIATILLPIARMAAGVLVDRDKTLTAADRKAEAGNPRSVEPLAKQQVTIEKSMRILAVDDDPAILELIPMLSARAGFSEVTPAASGRQALQLLGSSEAIFDCLLLDIRMPGMDGVELCRRIRQIPQYRETPIIMLTAMRDIANMGDAYRTGATDYVTKPFDIEELATRLRLAQEGIYAKRRADSAKHVGTESNWTAVRDYRFRTPEGPPPEGMEVLVDHKALSNYLTQLPRKEVAGVHVFAVILDGIEAFQTRSSPRQIVALLNDVAATVANCFDVDQTLMAYTTNATLLVAVNSGHPLPVINLEHRLEAKISGHRIGKDAEIVGLVGQSVQLKGAKAERANTAMDHAIALAENRLLNQHGKQIAGLSNR